MSQSVACGRCGVAMPAGKRHCTRCGAPLRPARKRFCSGCGAELIAGERFCGQCGAPVVSATRLFAAQKLADLRARKWAVVAILSFVLLVGLGVAWLVIWRSGQKPGQAPATPHKPSPPRIKHLADAGADLVAPIGQPVTVRGRIGAAPGKSPTIRWTVASAPIGSHVSTASLTDANRAEVRFVPDVPGRYVLALAVDEGDGHGDHDTVGIIAYKVTVHTSGLAGELGLSLFVKQPEDLAAHGARLEVPPDALKKKITLTLGSTDAPPPGAPFGVMPLGRYWVLSPAGTSFASRAKITLPIVGPVGAAGAYIGHWTGTEWEDLGGTIADGWITAELDGFSWFAVFPRVVTRPVWFRNESSSPTLTVTYGSGPEPNPDDPASGVAVGAVIPPGQGGIWDLRQGRPEAFALPPGRYRFVVAYPQPQPGVANDIFLTVPSGDESPLVVSIRDDGATSNQPGANIAFPGRAVAPGTNLRPIVACGANAPAGVPIASGDPTTPQLPSRVVRIAPIKLEQTKQLSFTASANDPEGRPIRTYWTIRSPTGHHTIRGSDVSSGAAIPDESKLGIPSAGFYRVFLTVYDPVGLFDECRWELTVVPNTRPEIAVVSGRTHVEFGRLDEVRQDGVGSIPTAPALVTGGVAGGPLTHCPSALAGETDPATGRIGFRKLPKPQTVVTTPAPVDTLKAPAGTDVTNRWKFPGRTCVWALIADGDLDPQDFEWEFPEPIFGSGTLYAAFAVPPGFDGKFPDGIPIGTFLRTRDQLDVYNAFVSSLWNTLGVVPAIVWEAWDDPCPPGVGTENPCPTAISRGGVENIVGTTSDGFSVRELGWAPISVGPEGVSPDCENVFFISSLTPSPADPGPGQSVVVTARLTPIVEKCTVRIRVAGTDGFNADRSIPTNKDGEASMSIPGGARNIVDTVTATVEGAGLEMVVTYTF